MPKQEVPTPADDIAKIKDEYHERQANQTDADAAAVQEEMNRILGITPSEEEKKPEEPKKQ